MSENMTVPLKTLYLMLIDMYENAYPIPYIRFREVFDKYMRLTKDNLIDAVVLMIYGVDSELMEYGTGEEDISVERIRNSTYAEEVKTVRSPFYRFLSKDEEIRIGYDYARVEQQADAVDEDAIETDEKNKKFPNVFVSIDPEACYLEWVYNNRKFEIDLKNQFFRSFYYGERYDLTDATPMENQPSPEGTTVKTSYRLKDRIVSELTDGRQFCFLPDYFAFDMIVDENIPIERKYII